MLPKEIQIFFEQRSIRYEILKHKPTTSGSTAAVELGINPERVAVTSVLHDSRGNLLVIYPSNAQLDISKLNEKLKRDFSVLSEQAIALEFPTYHKRQCLPLALIYRIGAEVYAGYASSQSVYFQINDENLCRISGADFCKLQGPAMYDDFFVQLPETATVEDQLGAAAYNEGRKTQIQQRLNSITSLPSMPVIAQRLLQLSNNPYAGARDLAGIISQDPSLSAQLIRYARSPLYGYGGEIHSIQDVISRVLGFDMVMDMALGVSVGKMFKNPRAGKIGLNEFWRHATYSAVLTQKLCAAVKSKVTPRPGMAYLTALLHNFGYLLLGHLFPQEFALLNRAATKYPESPTIELENTIIGATHMELGVWLMQAWNMPDEVIVSIREHHNEHYHDSHCVYPNLILVANRLLADIDIGDEKTKELPPGIVEHLSLDMEKVREIYDDLVAVGQGLDYMALQMAA